MNPMVLLDLLVLYCFVCTLFKPNLAFACLLQFMIVCFMGSICVCALVCICVSCFFSFFFYVLVCLPVCLRDRSRDMDWTCGGIGEDLG